MTCDEIGNDPKELRATVSQGDDWVFRIIVKSAGAVVNLTGWNASAIAKKTGQSDVTLGSAIVAASGQVTFTLTDDQTAAMLAGDSEADLNARWKIRVRLQDNAGLWRCYFTVNLFLIK
jgi:hypothetical protein